MKILHIAQAPGGVERYIHTLLSHIDQSRYENVLLCSKQFNKENFSNLTSAVEELSMKRNIGPGDIKNVMAILFIAIVVRRVQLDAWLALA